MPKLKLTEGKHAVWDKALASKLLDPKQRVRQRPYRVYKAGDIMDLTDIEAASPSLVGRTEPARGSASVKEPEPPNDIEPVKTPEWTPEPDWKKDTEPVRVPDPTKKPSK